MKLSLNREYAIRHLGVAALMAALCAWFIYDGAVTYPAMGDKDFAVKILHLHPQGSDPSGDSADAQLPDDFPAKRKAATDRQFQFAAIAGLAAFIIAAGVLRAKRQTLEWSESSMCGSLTRGQPLAFADVAELDKSRWEKKGILVVRAKDGRKLTLDAWHHAGVKELAAKLGVA